LRSIEVEHEWCVPPPPFFKMSHCVWFCPFDLKELFFASELAELHNSSALMVACIVVRIESNHAVPLFCFALLLASCLSFNFGSALNKPSLGPFSFFLSTHQTHTHTRGAIEYSSHALCLVGGARRLCIISFGREGNNSSLLLTFALIY